MRTKIAAVLVPLVLVACSSERGLQPQSTYRPVGLIGPVEVREYDARVAAQTVVSGDQDAARKFGETRLADYFGGANRARAHLRPAGPLAQAAEGPGQWRIGLPMPAGTALADLPRPDDPSVELVPMPPETYAVLRFPGTGNADQIAKQTGALVSALEGSAWRPAGVPVAWFYGAPFATSRNEVAIPVSPK